MGPAGMAAIPGLVKLRRRFTVCSDSRLRGLLQATCEHRGVERRQCAECRRGDADTCPRTFWD